MEDTELEEGRKAREGGLSPLRIELRDGSFGLGWKPVSSLCLSPRLDTLLREIFRLIASNSSCLSSSLCLLGDSIGDSGLTSTSFISDSSSARELVGGFSLGIILTGGGVVVVVTVVGRVVVVVVVVAVVVGGEGVVVDTGEGGDVVFCVVLVVTSTTIVTIVVVDGDDVVTVVVDDSVVSVILNCSVVDEIRLASALSIAD